MTATFNDEAILLGSHSDAAPRIGIDADLNAQTLSLHFDKIGNTENYNYPASTCSAGRLALMMPSTPFQNLDDAGRVGPGHLELRSLTPIRVWKSSTIRLL